VKRREFLGVLGGALAWHVAWPVAWPLAARAQQAMPAVGFLRSTTPFENLATAFRQGLKDAGFVEGQNVAVEYRYANNQRNQLPALAAELIRRPVAVIVGDNVAAMAAKAATATVPIVFATGGDPVANGLVKSLNRPGGNVTGVSFFSGELGSKRLQLLRQLVPKATTIAMLADPETPTSEAERRDLQVAAQAVGVEFIVLSATSDRDIDAAFATLVQRRAGALIIGASARINARTERIVALAARHALPAIHYQREAAVAGCLMSYGASITDSYRQAGGYAGQILKGEKPADMPVMRSTKFEFVINLKTAKALGLEIHPQLLATADEVIE